MKGALAAAAVAALTGVASAARGHRHAHNLFAKRDAATEVCGYTTIWTTITGEATLVQPQKTATSSSIVTPAPATSEVVVYPVPTPAPRSCPTPGTYTFPATTITLTETTTVCGATSTQVPAGTHTIGGVTTVVKTATTIVCPVATVQTSGTVTTSTIVQTTYVCPAAGTYTIAPITTTVPESTVIVYPVPTSYAPGTYTAPAQVITVTETDYVTYCPFSSAGLPTAAPVASSAPAYAPPPPQSTSKAPAYAPPATKPAPKPAAVYKAPSGSLIGTNDHYGVTYTPYEPSNGNCKSASQVDQDIAAVKKAGFQIVRVYSTDCNTLEYVGAACKKYGLQIILGVFVKGTGCSYNSPDIKEQVDAISAWANWDLVKLFSVGNEALMNGYCTPTELRELIIEVKSKCSGYKGPYTISETLNIWQRSDVSSAICDVISITSANIHAFFNSDVEASSAGDFVLGQLELLKKICPGNDVLNLESGWPKSGECNGVACPGVSQQAAALKSIREKCGDKTVFFSISDDQWKQKGAFGCEQSWGIANYFSM